MLITKLADVRITNTNIDHYRSKGYDCKQPDIISVKVIDLFPTSKIKILYECDMCGKKCSQNFINRPSLYEMIINNENILCTGCSKNKTFTSIDDIEKVESLYWNENKTVSEIARIYNTDFVTVSQFMKKYKIPKKVKEKLDQGKILSLYFDEHYSIAQISELLQVPYHKVYAIFINNNIELKTFSEMAKDDIWQRRIRKFYVEKEILEDLYISQELDAPDIAKIYNTTPFCVLNLLKYFAIPARSISCEHMKEKRRKGTREKFGVDYFMLTPEFFEKKEATLMEQYGVDNLFKLSEFQEKAKQSMYQNETAPCSNQQRYLYNLIGIDINYPVGGCFVDILLEDNIICEYDGGGHNLGVIHGELTQKEFDDKERKREKFLKGQGYKIIRIISKDDYLPLDEIIIQVINQAKEYLNSKHTWFEINIDKLNIRCAEFEKDYDFGKLRYIKEQDLEKFKSA